MAAWVLLLGLGVCICPSLVMTSWSQAFNEVAGYTGRGIHVRSQLEQCHLDGHLKFSYDMKSPLGPYSWTRVSPCCGGQLQSPVDIPLFQVEPYCLDYLSFDCSGPVKATLVNTGKTAKWYHLGGETLLRGVPTMEDSVFILRDLHLHWGSVGSLASEHKLDGVGFTAEMHFVFFNKKYGTFYNARRHQDGLVVTAVFIQEGATTSNVELRMLLDSVEDIQQSGTKVTVILNPGPLLPPGTKFVTYEGSLTTPPCTQNVRWIVFQTPHLVFYSQMRHLRRLMSDESGVPISLYSDERPCQSLNGRRIQGNIYCPSWME